MSQAARTAAKLVANIVKEEQSEAATRRHPSPTRRAAEKRCSGLTPRVMVEPPWRTRISTPDMKPERDTMSEEQSGTPLESTSPHSSEAEDVDSEDGGVSDADSTLAGRIQYIQAPGSDAERLRRAFRKAKADEAITKSDMRAVKKYYRDHVGLTPEQIREETKHYRLTQTAKAAKGNKCKGRGKGKGKAKGSSRKGAHERNLAEGKQPRHDQPRPRIRTKLYREMDEGGHRGPAVAGMYGSTCSRYQQRRNNVSPPNRRARASSTCSERETLNPIPGADEALKGADINSYTRRRRDAEWEPFRCEFSGQREVTVHGAAECGEAQ